MKDLLGGSEGGNGRRHRQGKRGVSESYIGRDEVTERSGTCAISGLLQHKLS